MPVLSDLHNGENVQGLMLGVETAHLARELGIEDDAVTAHNAIDQLRMVAMLSAADQIGESQVDSLLNSLAGEQGPLPTGNGAITSFAKWDAYMTALADTATLPSVDELLLFAAMGLLARQPVEVRSLLRQQFARSAMVVEDALEDSSSWAARVQTDISLSLLSLIRQHDHNDVSEAATVIQNLSVKQKQLEAAWLAEAANPRREAMALLGLYHLAQAVVRLSEFLLTGSVVDAEGAFVTDFAPELRRLLVRAEEYISIAGDQEVQFWLSTVVIVLWRLRTDSIWVSGSGISERLDRLIGELAREGRERPVFSLLPSQQDALRQSLLDPTRIAVVLQMPTSAGKTLLAEFAIVQAFEAYRGDARVVYVVPTRALATQVRRTLSEDLRPLGIEVSAAGSAFEEDPYELQLLVASDGVVVATPEKLDLLLRSHPEWFERLRLVVVDEAHLLNDDERGVRLELLLANLRRERPQCRLLLLTPFIGNARQIATWLGGQRGLPIEVRWRPSRLLLGIATMSGGRGDVRCRLEWKEPYRDRNSGDVLLRFPLMQRDVSTTTKKVVLLAERFMRLGSVLALYSAAPKDAEAAAFAVARSLEPIPSEYQTPALRIAIAIARDEYGPSSVLAKCLERGTAFHHSSLSSTLRYLIEDQVRSGRIRFIAATTTLAQGMNFPVAAVLVHSVHKPYGRGDLSPAEFWNIAGRAGRVGMVDKGLVLFVEGAHRAKYDYYAQTLSQDVTSALLEHLSEIGSIDSLKVAYLKHPELRPFLQYLAHAAATLSPARALESLEELLQGSLANAQARSADDSRLLRQVARRYFAEIREKPAGYLRASDSTGLGSFSFDELFAKIRGDDVLRAGPTQLLALRQVGITRLVEALKWLPELDLGIGLGSGDMSAEAVGHVVQRWVDGVSIPNLADSFPGSGAADKIRAASRYVHSKVSQVISWGAHAYTRGWSLQSGQGAETGSSEGAMLGAYIQFGVSTPEAAVASLLGVPRQFAEAFGTEYRERAGKLTPERAPEFKRFVENADVLAWRSVTERTPLAEHVDAADVRSVVRQMQGLI